MSHFRHSKDKDGSCARMGGKAEDDFRTTMANRGHEVSNVGKDLQIRHVDFILDKKHKIEVKSAKRISRQDSEADDSFVWIEISNITNTIGKNGWLYGEADIIAFEYRDNFILVSRHDLVVLVESICDLKSFVKKPQDSLYKSYRRWDRPNEHVTLIKVSDLNKIKNKKIKKMLSPDGSFYLAYRNSSNENFQEIPEIWSFDFELITKERDKFLSKHKEVVIKTRTKV